MTPTEVKELLIRELPQLIRQDNALRLFVLDLVQDKFADKEKTEDRIDRILDELRRDREENQRRWDESQRKFEENQQRWEEDQRRWDESQRKFEKNQQRWEEDQRRWEEYRRDREENQQRWEEDQRRWEEYRRDREENQQRWEEDQRRWEEYRRDREENQQRWEEDQRRWEEYRRDREENQRRWDANFAEIKQLNRRYDSTIGALGARWGLHSEQSFRQALRSILEESFGVEVLNITEYDDDGLVFGHPDQIELDIIIKNGLLIIIEIKSSVSKGDMYIFGRKVDFYEQHHHRQANRKIVISPMVDNRAKPVAERLGIEVYSYADSVTVD